jgi:hypothetical protein
VHYYLRSLARYYREPTKFIKTARNIARGATVSTYVVSWPKTGRTWLRVLLGRALLEASGASERDVLDTYALSRRAGCDTVMFTHGGPFHLFDAGHYENLRFNDRRFRGKNVVFLTRDIRDTLVSSYFQESKRTGVFRGELDEFVRNPELGARKIVGFYNLWFENRHRPRAFLPITYEALHATPSGELARLLEFIGLRELDDAVLERAVEYANFGNMRRLETSRAFSDSMLLPARPDDGESRKVRRGKVGGYVDYLDETTLEYIEQVVTELGVPGCTWYFAQSGSAASAA